MKPGTANESLGDVSGERALNHAIAGTLDRSDGMIQGYANLGCWYLV